MKRTVSSPCGALVKRKLITIGSHVAVGAPRERGMFGASGIDCRQTMRAQKHKKWLLAIFCRHGNDWLHAIEHISPYFQTPLSSSKIISLCVVASYNTLLGAWKRSIKLNNYITRNFWHIRKSVYNLPVLGPVHMSPVDRAGSVSEFSPRHPFLCKNIGVFIWEAVLARLPRSR